MKLGKNINLLVLLSVLALFIVGCTTEPKDTGDANIGQLGDEILSEEDLPPAPSPPSSDLFGPKYKGQILAGSASEAPYIDFNEEDYQKATSEGKIILLYFYSLQSAPSIADQNAITDAFEDMIHPDIIGFRVNFDDSDTSAVEQDLAANLGVTKARMKIILRDGEVLQRYSGEWNSNTYVTQLTQYLY